MDKKVFVNKYQLHFGNTILCGFIMVSFVEGKVTE